MSKLIVTSLQNKLIFHSRQQTVEAEFIERFDEIQQQLASGHTRVAARSLLRVPEDRLRTLGAPGPDLDHWQSAFELGFRGQARPEIHFLVKYETRIRPIARQHHEADRRCAFE